VVEKLYLLDAGAPSRFPPAAIPVVALREKLKDLSDDGAVMVLPGQAGSSGSVWHVLSTVFRLLPAKRKELQEKRIEDLLEVILEFDPLSAVEARIDLANAEMRKAFLNEFPVIDAAAVHDRAGHGGTNKAQTAASWKKAGRILGLNLHGRMVFPTFQFDADGQPLPLLQKVLRALPADRSAWQRAFWLVAPNDFLDGARPLDLIREGDPGVIDAAGKEAQPVIG